MRSGVVATVLALLLAGCSEGGAPAQDDEEFQDLQFQASDTTGVIRGVVIDHTITPIAGATITVTGQGTQTESDDQGRFGFEDLEAGTYFLEISKAGFGRVQQSTDVVAGVATPPVMKILMQKIPGSEPFVVGQLYTGYMSCGFKLANYVFDADSCDPTGTLGYAATDDSAHTFETGTPQIPHWYQVEIEWEANQPLSQGLVTIQCATDNTGCGQSEGGERLCNVRGASPLICTVDRHMPFPLPGNGNNLTIVNDGAGFQGLFTVGLFSNCAVQCVVGAVGAGLALEQEVQLFSHVFYNYQPQEGWLFLDGQGVPQPI